jgi:hypothetical protein
MTGPCHGSSGRCCSCCCTAVTLAALRVPSIPSSCSPAHSMLVPASSKCRVSSVVSPLSPLSRMLFHRTPLRLLLRLTRFQAMCTPFREQRLNIFKRAEQRLLRSICREQRAETRCKVQARHGHRAKGLPRSRARPWQLALMVCRGLCTWMAAPRTHFSRAARGTVVAASRSRRGALPMKLQPHVRLLPLRRCTRLLRCALLLCFACNGLCNWGCLHWDSSCDSFVRLGLCLSVPWCAAADRSTHRCRLPKVLLQPSGKHTPSMSCVAPILAC